MDARDLREYVGSFPDGWTGIRWPTGWIDCRSYVESGAFRWELRVYGRGHEVEVITDPCACSDPMWCEVCPDRLSQQALDLSGGAA